MSIDIGLREWQKTSFATHKQLAGMALPEDDATQMLAQRLSESEKLIVSQLRKGVVLDHLPMLVELYWAIYGLPFVPKLRCFLCSTYYGMPMG